MMQRVARIELAAAIAVALAIAVSGPGYRLGAWGLSTAFMLLRWGAWVAIALALISIVHWFLLRRGDRRGATVGQLHPTARLLWIAVIVSLGAAAFPLWLTATGSRVPPIHDITTDTVKPPAFVALAPLRIGARNPVTYEGENVARQQREAYPDIKPATLPLPPAQAFARALAAARAMGWTIIADSLEEGRIEASDTTPFFGFVDDVVVRITAEGTGSRIDVRSKSRIGRSDIGANARRIRGYLSKLDAG